MMNSFFKRCFHIPLAPLHLGAGYVPLATWWKIGFGLSIFYISVFLGVGSVWWKVIGLY
jgi:di/tricarboxylate transporter